MSCLMLILNSPSASNLKNWLSGKLSPLFLVLLAQGKPCETLNRSPAANIMPIFLVYDALTQTIWLDHIPSYQFPISGPLTFKSSDSFRWFQCFQLERVECLYFLNNAISCTFFGTSKYPTMKGICTISYQSFNIILI